MEPVAGGPADDAPGKEVNDDGKVEPALACPDIGDVNDRQPARLSGRTKPLKSRLQRNGAEPEMGCLGDPMTTDGDPVIAKLARHARTAVTPGRRRAVSIRRAHSPRGQSEDKRQFPGGPALIAMDQPVRLAPRGALCGLTHTQIDQPCLSPDLSTARERLAVRLCLADACDPRRA